MKVSKFFATQNKPMMGWSSWNAFRINIDEEMIKEQADIMAENGMKEVGYSYINIDDGFFGGRDEKGVLYSNAKFPAGMKEIASYIHDKGFKAGIYTDDGITRCAARYDNDPNFSDGGGSYGYREIDFNTYFNDWGYDFIKVDWCGGEIQGLNQEEEYRNIAKHIKETGKKELEWEVCSWEFPGEWVTDIASHWRISQDIEPKFNSIVDIIDKNAELAEYAGPGHYNHMDMLQVGNGMTYEEDKAHFSMWAIMSSPLLTGNDLREMSKDTLEILTNKEVIALNQDSLGIQAERIIKNNGLEIWYKPTKNYKQGAIALFNRRDEAAEMTIPWKEIAMEGKISVRDLWEHEDKGIFEDSYSVTVAGHGIVVLALQSERNLEFKKVSDL